MCCIGSVSFRGVWPAPLQRGWLASPNDGSGRLWPGLPHAYGGGGEALRLLLFGCGRFLRFCLLPPGTVQLARLISDLVLCNRPSAVSSLTAHALHVHVH